ncbi:hypothetical protein B0E43_10370 [Algoriphagus sp. A40]|nr:hypothetical protein B0E43_10370 [Algoriphagus sp. A40]
MKSSSTKLFNVVISEEAAIDIEDAVYFFENKVIGLGLRFSVELKSHLDTLELNPFFQVRYKNVRCLPMKNFPFLIHFTINEKENEVNVRAVFHTSLNPKIWSRR